MFSNPLFSFALAFALGHPTAPAVSSELAEIGTSSVVAAIDASKGRAADTVRWVLQAEDSEARYRVREQLAGFDLPNDAVGVTRVLSGTLVLTADGSLVAEESVFKVDLTTLTTDQQMRDNYVRRRTLEVEQYPEATFVPRRFVDLPSPLPTSGTAEFQIEGDLTIRGVTRSVRWDVTAGMESGAVKGFATTAFPFETFEIAVPRVSRVLSVDNNIRLEMDFRMVAQAGSGLQE